MHPDILLVCNGPGGHFPRILNKCSWWNHKRTEVVCSNTQRHVRVCFIRLKYLGCVLFEWKHVFYSKDTTFWNLVETVSVLFQNFVGTVSELVRDCSVTFWKGFGVVSDRVRKWFGTVLDFVRSLFVTCLDMFLHCFRICPWLFQYLFGTGFPIRFLNVSF